MKTNILRQHGIEAIELDNGVVIASEAEKLTDITDWANDKLYEWLGYAEMSNAFDKANSDYTKKMFSTLN